MSAWDFYTMLDIFMWLLILLYVIYTWKQQNKRKNKDKMCPNESGWGKSWVRSQFSMWLFQSDMNTSFFFKINIESYYQFFGCCWIPAKITVLQVMITVTHIVIHSYRPPLIVTYSSFIYPKIKILTHNSCSLCVIYTL